MAHPRELIRKKAVELLMGATNAGVSVFASRVRPLISNTWQNELPAIIVYTMDDAGEIFNQAPREYLRKVELVVEIHAEGNDALDDTLDTLARQVERLLLMDDTLGGTANDLQYVRSRMVLLDQAETLTGACRVIFEAEYLDRHPDDLFNQSLPDLNTVATEYSLGNDQPNPADRAQTIIEDLNP
jgi:alpha-mannosidase